MTQIRVILGRSSSYCGQKRSLNSDASIVLLLNWKKTEFYL